jgi:hypothetical protein
MCGKVAHVEAVENRSLKLGSAFATDFIKVGMVEGVSNTSSKPSVSTQQ